METLTEAIDRLRAEGYEADFFATDDGMLACRACDAVEDPATMQIDDTVRFEGESNPDDEAILLAISCGCGCRGLYSAGYGPSTSRADVAVLQRLASGSQVRPSSDRW